MHSGRVGVVVVFNAFDWDSFGEVSLETVDTHVHESFQVAGVPSACGGIGEVHDGHASLPEVPLPNGVVGTLGRLLVCIEGIARALNKI